MISRIRRGNDFHVAWQIKRGGVAENLENVTDIKLERTIYGVTTEHTLYTVSGDTITAEIPAEVQTHYGQYKLTLPGGRSLPCPELWFLFRVHQFPLLQGARPFS